MSKHYFSNFICLFCCFILLIPFALVFSSSFSASKQEIVLSPAPVSIEQYLSLLTMEKGYWRGMLNSVLLVLLILPVQLIVSIITGYSFAKKAFIGQKILWYFYLITMLLPFESTILPNYLLMKHIKLFDTWWAVWFPMIVLPMPSVILRWFIQSIDNCYFDEFALNSNNIFKKYIHIIIPLSMNGITVVILLLFAELWGMVELPITMINDIHLYPLAVLFGDNRLFEMVNHSFAGSLLFLLPALIIFIRAKKILHGMLAGGLIGFQK